jgi:O-antigen ligase
VNGEDDVSAPDHIEASSEALQVVRDNPLGQGLGISGGNSLRFGVEGGILSENMFLGVGVEVGVLGMALYVLMIGAVARAGWRRAALSGDAWGYAAIAALVGTSIGGLFLHSFESPIVSIPAFVAAGMAVTVVPQPRRQPLVHASIR